MIKHKKPIGEGDARYRYVESLYVETTDGERFKLPFTKLAGGRAMVEHVRNGGKPYDLRGQHIVAVVEELNVLSRFRRANHGQVFEGNTAELISETNAYYENLNRVLKGLSTHRGYTNYFESWNPAEITEQDVVIESIKNLFVRETIDTRIEQALPVLARIQQQGQAMKEAHIFEAWANRLVEGTWSTPDTPEKQAQLVELLSKEFPVGADATNATEQLYDLIGDDMLFDQLETLADQDADADARQIVYNRLEELSDDPSIAEVLNQLNIDTDTPAEIEDPADEEMEEAIDPTNPRDYEIPAYLRKQQGQAPLTPADVKAKDEKAQLDFQRRAGNIDEADNLSTFEEGRCNMTAEGEECPMHGLKECNMEENLDTDGVMMTRPSNMSSESADPMLSRMKSLAGIIAK
jgi:hypothetical protein